MPRSFSRIGLALVLALGACLLTACSDPDLPVTHTPPAGKPVHPDVLGKADLQYYWQRSVPLAPGERILRMVVMEENLYFLTSRDNLVVLDAAVGNPKWQVKLATEKSRVFGPIHYNQLRLKESIGTVRDLRDGPVDDTTVTFDAVLLNTLDRVVVMDRRTGKVYRDFTTSQYTFTDRAACDGRNVYVATSGRLYVALQLMAGVTLWTADFGEMVLAPLALRGNRLLLGSTDGLLRCAATDQYGEELWEQRLPGPIRAGFHVDDRGLFLPCGDGKLYALELQRGRKLWDPFVFDDEIIGPLQVGMDSAFLPVRQKGLLAIDPATGRQRWALPGGRKVLALIDGTAYVLDRQRNLKTVNEMTGKIQATVPLHGFDFYAENLNAPALYTATRDGTVACIRREKAGPLTVDQLLSP